MSVFDLPKFGRELIAAREIFGNATLPAIDVFHIAGKKQQFLYTSNSLCGNSRYGYSIGLEDGDPTIHLIFKAPTVFDLPREERRQVLESGELEAAMELIRELESETPCHRFVEIYRDGQKYFGKTPGGNIVDLPVESCFFGIPEMSAEMDAGGGIALDVLSRPIRFTPFSGFNDSEKISRMVITEAPALMSFEYVLRTLERFLDIAERFQIPIQAS